MLGLRIKPFFAFPGARPPEVGLGLCRERLYYLEKRD
jgi:hypothetical protein